MALPASASLKQPFTPDTIKQSMCFARTWNDGLGGQCCRAPIDGSAGLCLQHSKDERWRSHGRVDGPVPQRKLLDFRKAAAQNANADAGIVHTPQRRSTHQRGRGLAVQTSKGLEDLLASDGEESASDGEYDPMAQGMLDLSRPLRFGSGAVVGAEVVAAHARGRPMSSEEIAETAAPVTPAPGTALLRAQKRGVSHCASDASYPEQKVTKRVRMQEEQATTIIESTSEVGTRFEHFGVPQGGRARLVPILDRWGDSRTDQILWLWTFLGDGSTKPVSTPSLHLWGLPGTGKTAILFDFLDTLGIRTVWLDCSLFFGIGELFAGMVELLRKTALEVVSGEGAPELPGPLQHRMPAGRQLRALDKVEAAMRPILDYLSACGHRKCVVVLDQAQELARLGPQAAELVMALPEVLQVGARLTIVTVGRLPLSSIDLTSSARDPPTVTFQPYTEAQAEVVLLRALRADAPPALALHLGTIVGTGLLKFAAPHLGRGIHDLLDVGQELLADEDLRLTASIAGAGGAFLDTLQGQVEEAVESRLGLGGLRGLCEGMAHGGGGGLGDSVSPLNAALVAASITLQHMTEAEKRLVLSAYLASRIHKDDDIQLFMPQGTRRRLRRRGNGSRRQKEDQPLLARAPRPAQLVRVIAIYHVLARQPQLLGHRLFEHLARLRESGLIRLEGACKEHEARVLCLAELPLARAIAGQLNIDLAEYLCD